MRIQKKITQNSFAIIGIFVILSILIFGLTYNETIAKADISDTDESLITSEKTPINLLYGDYYCEEFPDISVTVDEHIITFISNDDAETHDFFYPNETYTSGYNSEQYANEEKFTLERSSYWRVPHDYITFSDSALTFITWNWYETSKDDIIHMVEGAEVKDEKTFIFYHHVMKYADK